MKNKFLQAFVIALFLLTPFTVNADVFNIDPDSSRKNPIYVSTTPSNRNVILEEFTGRNCGYCPDGHRIANEIMANNPGRAWAINVHAGNYSPTTYPNMNTTDGTTIHDGFGVSSYPSGVVNRSTASVQYRDQWTSTTTNQLNQVSECNVGGIVNIDPATRTASITVEVYYTGNSTSSQNYLTVAMLQDSILGSQSDYGNPSYNPTQWIGNQYVHMHVLRDVITDNAWGDAISPTTLGTLITRTYTYQIPQTIGSPNGVDVDINNIYFLAWVSEQYQGTPTRPILNACNLSENNGTYYSITATANPINAGTVSGAGNYVEGATCTLTAMANSVGYRFTKWTNNGMTVSYNPSYSFTVTEDAEYVAEFISNASHWNVDMHQYPYNMSVTGIIQINGVEQQTAALEIGGFCGDECRGTQRLTYFPQVDRFLVFFTLYGDAGDVMSFRLYDHVAGQELDIACSSTISFVPDSFIGTPFDPYVFDFGNMTVEQVSNFSQGYNWWCTYIEQEGIDGLSMLEEALGSNGLTIRSQANGFNEYYAGYGWYGSLSSINNESSYRVITGAPCTVTMTGNAAVPSEHPITLSQGWTWIGYVPSTAMDINAAMSGLSSIQGDKLKSQQGYADYYPGYGWFGSLNTIEPGMGLMYYSANSNPVTFTYPDNGRGGELKKNLTAEDNHWKPNVHAYPDNMTVMALVELDDVELASDNYELAAFAANGECRGSVTLTYAEPLHRYVAFLTISGKDAVELSFRLYNTETNVEYYEAEESLDFVANAIVGGADDLYTIHFRGAIGMDEFAGKVRVYPNPVNCGEQFSISLASDETKPVRVEIINTLGVVVETVHAPSPQTVTAPNVAGVYTLRISCEDSTCCRRIVVR